MMRSVVRLQENPVPVGPPYRECSPNAGRRKSAAPAPLGDAEPTPIGSRRNGRGISLDSAFRWADAAFRCGSPVCSESKSSRGDAEKRTPDISSAFSASLRETRSRPAPRSGVESLKRLQPGQEHALVSGLTSRRGLPPDPLRLRLRCSSTWATASGRVFPRSPCDPMAFFPESS